MRNHLMILALMVMTYFTIFLPSLILNPLDMFNDGKRKTNRYIPKSQRWQAWDNISQGAGKLSRTIINSIWNRIEVHETTWKEYKERKRRREMIRAARQFAQSTDEDDGERPTMGTRHRTPPPWHPARLFVNQVKAMETTNAHGEPIHENIARFDTDSGAVGIDNRASACISHDINDFDGPLRKVNRSIKGFGGERVWNVMMGTIVWKWCDNQGRQHKFRIPNSYYIPDGKVRLLSPQHWAKTNGGASARGRHTIGETTNAFKTTLYWNDGQNELDVYLGKTDNVATFYLAPGFKNFDMFCQKCEVDYDATMESPLTVEDTQVISDDE